jgi:hypothetical protein
VADLTDEPEPPPEFTLCDLQGIVTPGNFR